jgi:FAD dependent oxidoreductase
MQVIPRRLHHRASLLLIRSFTASTSAQSTNSSYDVGIVGGGIVGAATARELLLRHPKLKVAIFEKESQLGIFFLSTSPVYFVLFYLFYFIFIMYIVYCSVVLVYIVLFCILFHFNFISFHFIFELNKILLIINLKYYKLIKK